MKVLLYVFYFLRSAWGRGPGNTFRLIRAELKEEKRFGIKTATIKKSGSREFFHYQGASYRVLQQLLGETIKNTRGFDFVDIGCGKGRALFAADQAGYSHLTGIELDQELLEDAKQNLQRYLFKRVDSTFHFIHANALQCDYKNKPTLYFLFNPFNETVLKNVLEKIRASTQSETWFVYMNPLFRQVFERGGGILVKEFKTNRYLEAVVYRWPEKS